jgi:hypothetical protein
LTTNCVFPPELDEKQLLAYLDDASASPETARHLDMCPHCRERAEALDRFQKRLTHQIYRITCPTPMELGEYHLRNLPAPQRLVIAQHLRECPHCTQEIARLEEFLGEFTPPMTILETAKVLVAKMVGGRGEGTLTASPALRGEVKGPLTLEANGIVIVLDMQPTRDGTLQILGQVAADDQGQWTGAAVDLKQEHEIPLSTTVDDLGTFQLEGILPGPKDLRLTSRDGTFIVLSNFEATV